MILKKRRTTWIVAAAAAVTLTVTTGSGAAVRAQGTGAGRPTPQQMQQMRARQIKMRQMRKAAKEKMFKDLGVTPAQRKKLDALEAATQRQIMSKFKAVRAMKTQPTPQQQQQIMGQLRSIAMQSRRQMLAVLTPAQRQKYVKIAAAQMKKARAMRGGSQAR